MSKNNRVVGVVALALGVFTAITPAWAETTPVGTGATVGLGALTAMYALWSLIARDPTKDHWALSVVGLIMVMAPWLGMFAGDAAAWVSWIVGAAVMVLGGASYVRDEAGNISEESRMQQRATYQSQYHVAA